MRRETGDPSFRVTYLVRAAAGDVAARAEALLLEQTVELPRAVAARDPWVADHILGCVEEIRPAGVDLHRVTIAQPLATTAGDPAQFLSVLFGNCSLQPDVLLADVELPDAAFDWLPGPRAGVAGLRELTGVSGRPLLATALKPMGLKPAQLAALCGTFARAGIDLIKDDHGLADHPFCPFEARVEACLAAIEAAARETGRRALYVPNLTGTPDRVRRQLEFARRAGVSAVMLSPMVVGLPLLHELAVRVRRAPDHGASGLRRCPARGGTGTLRQALPLVRGGRGHLSACRRALQLQRGDLPRHRRRAPGAAPAGAAGVPRAGRRHPVERVGELLEFYGNDCILLIGGSLYQSGDGLFDRTRELVEQVARAAAAESVP